MAPMKKIVCIVQARMGSSRLPGKVMLPIGNNTVIGNIMLRLSKSKLINEIIVATSINKENDLLEKFLLENGFKVFRGSENNVLERYYNAAIYTDADLIVRITGDCPFIDSRLVDEMIVDFLDGNIDYENNLSPATFPDGLDIEIFKFKALKYAYENAHSEYDKEHVTPYIKNSEIFTKKNFYSEVDLSGLRWTLDESFDYELIKKIFNYFGNDIFFSWEEVYDLYKKKPDLFSINQHIIRNEGSTMNTGQKLWKRAKQVIPGGNMLLSKRPEMFLPDNWPSYFSQAKGCNVWDLDNNKLTDMSIMGIGTNILGYGNDEVDQAVLSTISKGNMSTLNCPEEVYLAEKLVSMHNWADMARFARSGGEANSIAIRIARAYSGKDNIAICGYHGWHDWYLSANLSSRKELDGHLLPGLDPKGVPLGLMDTVYPFSYNDIDQLEELIINKNIGVIKMEVSRNTGPKDNFLGKVRRLATNNNIVLIFDECTSGFRETFGGLHLKYNVEPDIAMFGKALGNGYAITAILGRREFMQAAQSTFISSTFWTERIGPTAALKTLEIMEKNKSWEYITNHGKKIRNGWKDLAKEYSLDLDYWGLDALTGFTILSKNSLKYKTYITQEMLKHKFLASNTVYVCTAHTNEIIENYFELLRPIFRDISECEDGKDIDKILNSPVCHTGFKRLN